jgi:hypothetical protein
LRAFARSFAAARIVSSAPSIPTATSQMTDTCARVVCGVACVASRVWRRVCGVACVAWRCVIVAGRGFAGGFVLQGPAGGCGAACVHMQQHMQPRLPPPGAKSNTP